MVGYPAFA